MSPTLEVALLTKKMTEEEGQRRRKNNKEEEKRRKRKKKGEEVTLSHFFKKFVEQLDLNQPLCIGCIDTGTNYHINMDG